MYACDTGLVIKQHLQISHTIIPPLQIKHKRITRKIHLLTPLLTDDVTNVVAICETFFYRLNLLDGAGCSDLLTTNTRNEGLGC